MKLLTHEKRTEQSTSQTRAVEVIKSNVFRLTIFALALITLTASQAVGQTDGIMMVQNSTTPRGGVWLSNSTPATLPGGHYWQPDNLLGICRVDPLPGGSPPWQLTNCQVTAKSSGQAVVATPGTGIKGLPAGARFVFVADASSKSISVVRYVFDPAKEQLSGALPIQVQNLTSV